MNDDLAGHRGERAGLCYDCRGPLRDSDGSYASRLVELPGGRTAFAASICKPCKKKANTKAPDIDPEDKAALVKTRRRGR